jgi:predicted nucleotidyltransferase
VQEEIDVTSPRGKLAVRLRDVIERRWPAEVQAIGVHGSLAHGDDHDGSDVNLLVVTYRPAAGPKPALRRVDGTLVDLEVMTGDEDAHLARLAETRPPEFTALARHNWALASAAHTRAVRLAEWYETDAALVMIATARLHAALVTGLLTRTYFRGVPDAVRRTGVAGADMQELSAVLKEQAEELAARGKPVDGSLNDLFQ